MTNGSGGRIGSPGLPIPLCYVSAALMLLVKGGEHLRQRRIVIAELSEDNITHYLCSEMEKLQSADASSTLLFDYHVGTPSSPSNPLMTGEVDIKFRWIEFPLRNGRYLAVEAKKLRGRGDSLAGKYVNEGVLDFVTGKYSRSHDHGIMVGYVVVAPVEKAVANVGKAMKRWKYRTAEQNSFLPDTSFCSHPHTHRSVHLQSGTNCSVTLVHLFLVLT